MARRVSLPSADDLFRGSADAQQDPDERDSSRDGSRRSRRPSGRVRHDEKMTIYVTAAELLEIEHARLALRSRHGLAVDRGRLVREAIHLVLADLEQNGEASALVRRLTEE